MSVYSCTLGIRARSAFFVFGHVDSTHPIFFTAVGGRTSRASLLEPHSRLSKLRIRLRSDAGLSKKATHSFSFQSSASSN